MRATGRGGQLPLLAAHAEHLDAVDADRGAAHLPAPLEGAPCLLLCIGESPVVDASADAACSVVQEQALSEAIRGHPQGLQVVPRLLDSAELTQQRQPPGQGEVAQLLFPEPLGKILGLAEHREHRVRGVVARAQIACPKAYAAPLVAQPARHVDGAIRAATAAGWSPWCARARARPAGGRRGRGVLRTRGVVGLLGSSTAPLLVLIPGRQEVSSNPIAASASSGASWLSRANRAAVR